MDQNASQSFAVLATILPAVPSREHRIKLLVEPYDLQRIVPEPVVDHRDPSLIWGRFGAPAGSVNEMGLPAARA